MGARHSSHRAAGDASHALFRGLIDHAALFPPASMTMNDALAEDRRARESPQAWLIGRFVCPASRLAELREQFDGESAPGLSVVLDGAGAAGTEAWLDALRADLEIVAGGVAAGAPVESLELTLPDERPASSLLLNALRTVKEASAATPYLELRLGDGWRASLPAAIGAAGTLGGRVKLRCGGERAEAFPSVEQVALVIVACRDAGTVFKATAGLHQPLRHTDAESGFQMHGFVNLLAAAALAHAHRLRASEVEGVLAEEDPSAFVVSTDGIEVGEWWADTTQIAAARAGLFAGYGSCSWREPVHALQALGMLER